MSRKQPRRRPLEPSEEDETPVLLVDPSEEDETPANVIKRTRRVHRGEVRQLPAGNDELATLEEDVMKYMDSLYDEGKLMQINEDISKFFNGLTTWSGGNESAIRRATKIYARLSGEWNVTANTALSLYDQFKRASSKTGSDYNVEELHKITLELESLIEVGLVQLATLQNHMLVCKMMFKSSAQKQGSTYGMLIDYNVITVPEIPNVDLKKFLYDEKYSDSKSVVSTRIVYSKDNEFDGHITIGIALNYNQVLSGSSNFDVVKSQVNTFALRPGDTGSEKVATHLLDFNTVIPGKGFVQKFKEDVKMAVKMDIVLNKDSDKFQTPLVFGFAWARSMIIIVEWSIVKAIKNSIVAFTKMEDFFYVQMKRHPVLSTVAFVMALATIFVQSQVPALLQSVSEDYIESNKHLITTVLNEQNSDDQIRVITLAANRVINETTHPVESARNAALEVQRKAREIAASWPSKSINVNLSSIDLAMLSYSTVGLTETGTWVRRALTAVTFWVDGGCIMISYLLDSFLPDTFDMTFKMQFENSIRAVAWWQSLYSPLYEKIGLKNYQENLEQVASFEEEPWWSFGAKKVTELLENIIGSNDSASKVVHALTNKMQTEIAGNGKNTWLGLSEEYIDQIATVYFSIPRMAYCLKSLLPRLGTAAYGGYSWAKSRFVKPRNKPVSYEGIQSNIGAPSDLPPSIDTKKYHVFYGAPMVHVFRDEVPDPETEGRSMEMEAFTQGFPLFTILIPVMPDIRPDYKHKFSNSTFVTDPELEFIYELDLDHECYIDTDCLDPAAQGICRATYRFRLPNHYYAKHFYKLTREEENLIARNNTQMLVMRLMLTHSLNPMNAGQLLETKEQRKEILDKYLKPHVKSMTNVDIMSVLLLSSPEYTSFWLRMVHISMCKDKQ